MKPASEIIAPFLKAIGYTGKATANASVYPEDLETLIILIEEERIEIKQQADRHLLDQAVRYEHELARWQRNYYEMQREIERVTRVNNELMYGKDWRPRNVPSVIPTEEEMERMRDSLRQNGFTVPTAGFVNKGTP